MEDKLKDLNWIDKVFSGIRVMWVLLWIIIFASNGVFHETVIPFEFLLLWLTLSYILPQIFLLPAARSYLTYYLLEFFLSGSLYVYLLLIVGSDSSLILIPFISLGLYFSRSLIWLAVTGLLMMIPFAGFYLQSESLIVLFTHILNNIIALGVGYAFNRIYFLLRENQKQYLLIRDQKAVLEQYAKKVESLTLLEERNRMASELHDTTGHTFTSVIVGIDGIIANLKLSDTEKALNKLQILRDLTRKGLDEIRKTIHMMPGSEEEESLLCRLTSLANDFEVHTGTIVHFKCYGQERDPSYHAQHTMMRCLQEGLTNAKRHGEAQNIYVTLEYGNESIALTIRDDGKGGEDIELGFGLNGMKQRLHSLNGYLHIAAASGSGLEVTCKIPIQGDF
ncbi:sensor histidine kinase [Bacillus sp. S/N-304-OC-R1]|uniref:sensor histidine kinase n=1 Tax=Bacillus sp. S/N-304-OC-R1 TaxID=2758034 RepID=UPI001C8D6538|nr:sensor histidine kinase [Bacillus sp. S/N-304-OC-R1]MBY0123575.1 sensor histidine kinase [Bacillus sp. S/N-304-OC-R1]